MWPIDLLPQVPGVEAGQGKENNHEDRQETAEGEGECHGQRREPIVHRQMFLDRAIKQKSLGKQELGLGEEKSEQRRSDGLA